MHDTAPQSLTEQNRAAQPENALRLLLEARIELARLLAAADFTGSAFPSRINAIIRTLLLASSRDPDVLIASILLHQESEYTVRHAVNVALVANHLLSALGHDVAHRSPVIGAALTMNIGMHALQEKLAKQSGPLTTEQRLAMQLHPTSGRDILRKLDISDPLWLDCVAQHHEVHDGSGYPARLKGDAIHFEARLIGMADRYCALLSRAAWRHEQLADSALLTALGCASGSPDARLGRLFIETLGVYSTGTLVQLINGEIGIVKSQGSNETTPLVACLFNAILDPLPTPVLRNTSSDDYCIVGVLNHRKMIEPISMETIWGDEARL